MTRGSSAVKTVSQNQNEVNEKKDLQEMVADLESSNQEKKMSEQEATVFYRDVLQFRATKESFLTANETNQLLLDFNRNYRALLLTAVSSEEKITISDAVCLLRDILIMCHEKGQTWSSLALELNSLFDKKVRKPFTINDLKLYLKATSNAYLSFAEPYDVDREERMAKTNNKIDLRQPIEDSKVITPQTTETEVGAVDQNGTPVDWDIFVGQKISVNQIEYQVKKSENQILLINGNMDLINPKVFNNQVVEIQTVTDL